MTITAKVIADSISENSPRLTTLQLRYPKFIHGELMTHRVFSRNASSSRAIPVKRLIQDVMDDPAIPTHWGANQKGMQAAQECTTRIDTVEGFMSAKEAWLIARDDAVSMAEEFDKSGYHKQIVNRIIEPFCHINVVVTATEWSNFFALRRHPDSQPEMRALADAIYFSMEESKPIKLDTHMWHLPYLRSEDIPNLARFDDTHIQKFIAISVARCARVSYLTQEGKAPSIEEDLKLYNRLIGQTPLHASPAEHQASPDEISIHKDKWLNPHRHGNLKGWVQFRKTLPNECQ